ncbi:hypothetical protein [Nannocystis radixulma]|uniref:Uncharacterized protein n=1 Tax=Nannocystis radixulma TaxID=2995305 RepID=A0ABT5B3W4_9BACT|nr:hypothetical protein [Nannocystis radixulma]MDC0668234.1 hypothetical protein [Nannocystis radixulma]
MLARFALSAALLAPSATEPPAFTGQPARYSILWSDGDSLLAAAEPDAVHLLCRTGERSSTIAGLGRVRGLAGRSIAGALQLVAVTEGGQLARWSADAWSLSAVPRRAVDELFAVALDNRGRAVVAGKTYALYIADGDRWEVLLYPPGLSAPAALAHDGDHIAVVGSRGQLVLATPEGSSIWTDVPISGGLDEPSQAWWSPASGLLWIVDRRELVAVDVARSRVLQRVAKDTSGGPHALTGLPTPQGDLLALAGQSTLGLLLRHEQRVRTLGVEVVFPAGFAFDVRGEALYVADLEGLRRIPLVDDALAAARALLERGPAPPCPLAPGRRVQVADDLLPAPRDMSSAPLAPKSPPRTKRSDRGELPIVPVRPTLRLGLGPAIAPHPPPARTTAGLAFDVSLGVAIALGKRGAYLWPEFGYAQTRRDGTTGHLFTFGLTPLFGLPSAAFGLSPKVVFGDAYGHVGAGLRSSLVGTFALQTLTFEIGHQWLRAGGRDLHDARLMFSLDVLAVVALLTAPLKVLRWLGRDAKRYF